MDWTSIEYGGRWKLLNYVARDMYNSVLVDSFCSPSIEDCQTLQIHVSSDIRKPIVNATLVVSASRWDGNASTMACEGGFFTAANKQVMCKSSSNVDSSSSSNTDTKKSGHGGKSISVSVTAQGGSFYNLTFDDMEAILGGAGCEWRSDCYLTMSLYSNSSSSSSSSSRDSPNSTTQGGDGSDSSSDSGVTNNGGSSGGSDGSWELLAEPRHQWLTLWREARLLDATLNLREVTRNATSAVLEVSTDVPVPNCMVHDGDVTAAGTFDVNGFLLLPESPVRVTYTWAPMLVRPSPNAAVEEAAAAEFTPEFYVVAANGFATSSTAL